VISLLGAHSLLPQPRIFPTGCSSSPLPVAPPASWPTTADPLLCSYPPAPPVRLPSHR
jgi:hypothetical protein